MSVWKLKSRSAYYCTPDHTTIEDLSINSIQLSSTNLWKMIASLHALSSELQQKENVDREEALKRVQSLWENGDPEETLSTIGTVYLSRHDFGTLKDGEWLNDKVIDAYMTLIMQRSQENPTFPKVYAFSTYFYTALQSQGYSKVARWTSNIDVFSYDVLLLPVYSNDHWSLIAFDRKRNHFAYFDSMAFSDVYHSNFVSKYHTRNFASYLVDESMNKRKVPYDRHGAKIIRFKKIPTQGNLTDCGLFLCTYAENMMRDNFRTFVFDQSDLQYLRFKMCYELGVGHLI